jgi:hypothetical protein
MMGPKLILSIYLLLIHLAWQEQKPDLSTVQERSITERIFLTTDRDDYIAGEVLWFSSWLRDIQNSQPSLHSAIARIEILNSANVQIARSTVRLDKCRGFGQIKLSDTLSSGMYTVRAYTNLMRNYMAEGWFEKNIAVYNGYKNKTSFFSTDAQKIGNPPDSLFGFSGLRVITKDHFSTRQKVNVEVQVQGIVGEPKLSVAVVPTGSVNPLHFHGSIKQARINSGESGHLQYKPEYDSYYVTGKLLTKAGKPSSPGEIVFFSVPGSVPVLKYARTDETGRFSFKIGLDEKIDEFILQTDKENAYQIVLESSFADDFSSVLPSAPNSPAPVPSHIRDMSVNAQIAIVYSKSVIGNEVDTARTYRKTLRFYGKPTKEVFLKDFIQLRNVEEIFFEIIPGVSLIKTGGRYEMQMKNSMGKVLYDSPPMMMIDGVIVRDPSIIIRLDPAEIERIDVVQDQYMVGDCIFDGIVNVITKTADFRNIPLPAGALRMQNNIFDRVYEFAAPRYSGDSGMADHEPDYRNTLYWNPDMKQDQEGKLGFHFWTSDATGYYYICVQGFTSAGEPFSGYKLIQVTR